MKHTIAVLAGDGIGPEIMAQALRVLDAISEKFCHEFSIERGSIGGEAYDRFGAHFPDETKAFCQHVDAILFGSVGGPVAEFDNPKWKNCEVNSLLALRKAFEFQVNFRPVKVYPELAGISSLKREILAQGVDLLIVRELLGDLYFGEHKTFITQGQRVAQDIAEYSEKQISAAAHRAFPAARVRKQKVTLVHKANVLDTSKLWCQVVQEISKSYPDVRLEEMLVDNCAMQIIKNPNSFDVILTSNMFGDILSDEASVLCGSLGLMPSASFNADGFGFYEPSGGSAPDIAGIGIANPVGQILSVALLLRFSFGMEEEAKAIEQAVAQTISNGYRTADIFEEGTRLVGTAEFTDRVIEGL